MRYEDPPAGESPALHLELISLLDTLPDALIFLDQRATIQYANVRAATMLGASQHELSGVLFWRCAPHLVTTVLYQAVSRAIQTRTPLQVEYRSPSTKTWLNVHLSPTSEGVVVCFHETTKRTRFQDALRQREQEYLNLLESIADGVTILTPDGLVLEINQLPLTSAHIQREEVIGKPFVDFPSWSAAPVAQRQLHSAIGRASRGETVRFETRVRPQPGRYVDLAMLITPHYSANQQIEYLICAARNITERKREEDALRALIDAIPHFVWIMSPDGGAEYSNQRWCDYIGMTSEQTQGDGWLQFVHPDDRQRIQNAWQVAVCTGTPYEVEHRIREGRTGDYHWFLARSIPYKDTRGTILHWIGTCTDIDDLKRAEEKIQASEENLRILAETVPQLVWTTQPDGRIDYTNHRYCDVTQADFEQIRGYGWRQFVHPEDLELTLARRQRSLETGELYENEYRLKDGRTGGYRWYLARALPVRDEAGHIIRWFGTGTDIEQQKQTEEVLRRSQERVRTLMDSTIIGIIIAEDDVIVEANDTFLRMTGYNREDLRQRKINWVRMTPPEYKARTDQAHEELARHCSMKPYEKEYVCKDGSRLPVLIGGVLLPFDPCHSIYFVLDNSARYELERRKNDFLGMASHELKTPLTAVKMRVQLARARLIKQGFYEAAAALERTEAPIKLLERLIGELLDVSKIQAGRLEYVEEAVDLEALLCEVADTMQQASSTHEVVVRGKAPHTFIGDKDRLEQVFINLISNAIKYSPGANLVEVTISTTEESVTISVRDFGIGIPQEQHEKIFERFYRADDLSQRAVPGLGMGLSIVVEIVRHHGGTVRVESELGHGSTFYVTLPLKRPGIQHDNPAQG